MEELERNLSNCDVKSEVDISAAKEYLLQKNLGRGDNLLDMLARIKNYGRPIPTGYAEIDALLNGGFRQGLSIIAAPPGRGKSTLCIQLAEQFSSAGVQTVYLCNDMSETEIISKAISRHTYSIAGEQGFGADEILGGHTPAMYSPIFHQACELFRNHAQMFRIEGDDFSRDLNEIEKLLNVYGAYGTSDYTVVIIDYLQNINVGEATGAKERLDILVRALKSLAKHNSLVVIAISSVNRSAYYHALAKESLKESGDIEFNADVILGIQFEGIGNPDFDERAAVSQTIRSMELVVLKNRFGAEGISIPLKFYPKFSVFPFYATTPKLKKTPIDLLLKRR